jgi:hypothetical protein
VMIRVPAGSVVPCVRKLMSFGRENMRSLTNGQ